jgi:hypothetical protein
MRIFSGAVLAALVIVAATGTLAASGVKYTSPQAAFEQGLGAYKSGYYEIAIPALEEAAAKGVGLNQFFAQFYLARIYSDNTGAQTDHAKAYMLFQRLATGLPCRIIFDQEATGVFGRECVLASCQYRDRQSRRHLWIDGNHASRRDRTGLLQSIVQDRAQDDVHHPCLTRRGHFATDQQCDRRRERQLTHDGPQCVPADVHILRGHIADTRHPETRSVLFCHGRSSFFELVGHFPAHGAAVSS